MRDIEYGLRKETIVPINEQKINENTSLNNSLNFALNSNIGYLSLIMEVLRLLNGA